MSPTKVFMDLSTFPTMNVKDVRVDRPPRLFPVAKATIRSRKRIAELHTPDSPSPKRRKTMSIREEATFLLNHAALGPACEHFYRLYGQRLEDYQDNYDHDVAGADPFGGVLDAELEAGANREAPMPGLLQEKGRREEPGWFGFSHLRLHLPLKGKSAWISSTQCDTQAQQNDKPGEIMRYNCKDRNPQLKKDPKQPHTPRKVSNAAPSSQSRLIHALIPEKEQKPAKNFKREQKPTTERRTS